MGDKVVTDLFVMSALAVLSVSILVFLAPKSPWWRLLGVPTYGLALGLALRFGARTYPGVYYPDSSFLNDLLNGSRLFTELGYDLLLALIVADLVLVFLTRFRKGKTTSPIVRYLGVLRLLLLSLTLLIIAYGCYYAVLFFDHWRV